MRTECLSTRCVHIHWFVHIDDAPSYVEVRFYDEIKPCISDFKAEQKKLKNISDTDIQEYAILVTHTSADLPFQCQLCDILLSLNYIILIQNKRINYTNRDGKRYWNIYKVMVWEKFTDNFQWHVEWIKNNMWGIIKKLLTRTVRPKLFLQHQLCEIRMNH